MNNCSFQESNSVKCDVFSASFKGICSYFPSIGETSVIAVEDENLLRQKKVNLSEVPAAVFPGCVLFGIIPPSLHSGFCLSFFPYLFLCILLLRIPLVPGVSGR